VQLELLQSAVGGDLVLGECKMRIADVVAAGTVHSWFPFIDAAEPSTKAAELLMAINAKGAKPVQKPVTQAQLPAVVRISFKSILRKLASQCEMG
jgi:microcystin degradation protein MlrC